MVKRFFPGEPWRGLAAPGLLVCLISLAACAPDNAGESPAADAPRRIISLVPAVTEMLFALGAGDRVIGVSDFDSFPPEVEELPRVGALLNPNLEVIFELQPDLVITYGTQSQLRERLGAAGIRQHPFTSGSIEDMLASIRDLGAAIDMEVEGERLAAEIEGELDRVAADPPDVRPEVLLVHSRDAGEIGSFYSAGADSYLNELIEIAGGRNIFEDAALNAFQPSLEEVLTRNPEVIVELLPSSGGGGGELSQRMEDWRRLESIAAVRSGRVHILADDYLLLIGPRLPEVARRLAEVIRQPAPLDSRSQ